jgi:Sulfotransferase family
MPSDLLRVSARVAKRLNPLITPLERAHVGPIAPAPLLIVGPPRSGTTLLYQLMVQHLDVAYLSNAHHAIYGAPFLVERFVPRRFRKPPASYESRFGVTHGLWAPSEARNFWYRFFPLHPHAVDANDVPPAALAGLRGSFLAMTRASGKAVVTKNVVCSVRIGAISAAMPEMRYLVMHRDLVDTAASLLASRKEATGTYDQWWSVEPEGIGAMRSLPPEQQVVEQIRAVDASIQASRASLQADCFVDVEYADLTRDPESEIGRLASALDLRQRPGSAQLPARFERHGTHALESDLMERLVRYARQ